MKKPSHSVAYILLATTAALVLVFYFQTRLMDVDRHNAASRDLLNLKQLDTQLNEETLKAVSLQLKHYDGIVDTVSRMKALSTKLSDPSTGLAGLVSAKVDDSLDTFKSLLAAKLDLTETIKSRAAIMRNTLNYVPLEVARITQGQFGPDVAALHQVLSAMLIHNLLPSETSQQNLVASITALETVELSPTKRTEVEKVLHHVRANINAISDISTNMTDLLKLPTLATLDRIIAMDMDNSIAQIKTANQFRVILLTLSMALFIGLGLALRHLRNAHDESDRISRQFRDAAQSIGEGFAFFDTNSQLSFWNPTFARLHKELGIPLHVGVSFGDFYKACVDARIYQKVHDNNTHLLEDSLTHALGRSYVVRSANGVWMLATDSPMADGGIACVRIDITQTKQAEAEMRKLSLAVEQSPASVMITDTKGNITYVNPKFEDSTGYTSAEAIGQQASMISSGEKSSTEYQQLWKTISAGGEWRGEFHNKHKNGTLFWEYASISAIKNELGEVTSYLAVKEDITQRKRDMAELIAAKEQAELASYAKTQFLANMSHELRTPLNAIIGFSEMIKGQMFGPIGNENYVEYGANILSSGQHLLDVINDILDVSRIETGTMEIRDEYIDIAKICHSCLEMMQPQADFAKQNLHSSIQDELPNLRGDAMRIKQIVLNLLSNAIKFTPRGGLINLEVAHRSGDMIDIIVSDTGSGIPLDKQHKILEPFEQLSDIYTRSHEGSGLGLFLVNSFVKLHKGSLSIDSVIDGGTTVTVHLPTIVDYSQSYVDLQ
ncbi:DAHL domain-containing protein [Magnetovibrio blakemorei]|uniref:histidine kinase n=1 Tax=Magnetovibrio blakemorei TaxID=28181 RepID=A0A1E5QAE1_9PROT|nr:DAHL domain-containing protein [Magnetovibrio blakemorei]OEJ68906.1 hypothetical protein BEN30_05195 [Magnetovibrio blakemorei]